MSKKRLRALLTPFQSFAASGAAGGVILFAAALVAFGWANSPWAGTYEALRALPVSVGAGGWGLEKSLEWWVNDGLMALFFLLVGLEIKRELLVGELASPRRAALAAVAALGGMLVPAGLYALVNAGGPGARGWGVPMATDIAFALGVLALLGDRVPLGLKVLLTALAIVDDLGAVLVIALFYTGGLDLPALGAAGLVLGLAFGANALGVRHLGVYGVLGAGLWYAVLESGLHPTVAGVLLAFAVPIARRIEPPLPELTDAAEPGALEAVASRLERLEGKIEEVQSPLHRLEHGLQPWTAYLILPVFALLNAGVPLRVGGLDPITLGVALGLVVGKPLGVLGASWLAVRLRLAALPEGVGWGGMAGLGLLAGVGFTMSLFIAALAFGEGPGLDAAKLGVLFASLAAALAGLTVLSRSARAGAERL